MKSNLDKFIPSKVYNEFKHNHGRVTVFKDITLDGANLRATNITKYFRLNPYMTSYVSD
jgi:hypothetical protein